MLSQTLCNLDHFSRFHYLLMYQLTKKSVVLFLSLKELPLVYFVLVWKPFCYKCKTINWHSSSVCVKKPFWHAEITSCFHMLLLGGISILSSSQVFTKLIANERFLYILLVLQNLVCMFLKNISLRHSL